MATDEANPGTTPLVTATGDREELTGNRRHHGGCLKDDTSFFLLSEHLCDTWFTFKGSDEKLPAHKLMLSMRSEVFEAMFYGPMAENSETVLVEDIDEATMTILLRYIYTDEVVVDEKNVMQCVYAAKKYALHSLVDTCMKFLEAAISIGTACEIYEQAEFYEEESLQTKCFDFIVENSYSVFKSGCFRTLSYNSMLNILACDHLASDESVNFDAAKTWTEQQCKKNNLDASAENLRSCLGDILYQIRFPLMSPELFAMQVAKTGILTNEEMLDVYFYLATKTGSKEKQKVGKFSCKKRTVVVRIDSSNLSQAYQGYVILLNTSNPVKLVCIKGEFAPDVFRISASNAGRQDVAFMIGNDCLYLTDPLLLRPHSGNIQINLTTNNKHGLDNMWSANANISRTVKDTTINVRRVPHGMRSLVFEEV